MMNLPNFPQKYVRAVPFKGVEGGGTEFLLMGGVEF